ncbi:MAG: hypothetical protein ACRDBG_21470 [Waterburya sp.]
MTEKQKVISKFIDTSWTNMNIRAGKYRHLQTKSKCKNYNNITITFDRNEYKNWCLLRSKDILSLKRPSIDRIDSKKNYDLDNIQIIELRDNIAKKRIGNRYLNGPKSKEIRGVRFNGKWTARIHFKTKEYHLGTFNTKNEALTAFRNKYFEFYKKYPF